MRIDPSFTFSSLFSLDETLSVVEIRNNSVERLPSHWFRFNPPFFPLDPFRKSHMDKEMKMMTDMDEPDGSVSRGWSIGHGGGRWSSKQREACLDVRQVRPGRQRGRGYNATARHGEGTFRTLEDGKSVWTCSGSTWASDGA